MKRIIIFACLIACVNLNSYSQGISGLQSKLEKAALKARAEYRAQKANEERIKAEEAAKTNKRIQSIESGNQYLQQNFHASDYKKGPSSRTQREQNAGREMSNYSSRNGSRLITKGQSASNSKTGNGKPNSGVRSWPIAEHPWDYSHHEGGHNADAVKKMFNTPLLTKQSHETNKFKKPGRVMYPQNNQPNTQSLHIASAEVKAKYGENNPQVKNVSSNEEQRKELPAKVATLPQYNSDTQPSVQQPQQQTGTTASAQVSQVNIQQQYAQPQIIPPATPETGTVPQLYDSNAPNPDFITREIGDPPIITTEPKTIRHPESSLSIRISLGDCPGFTVGGTEVKNKSLSKGLEMNSNAKHDIKLKKNDPVSEHVVEKRKLWNNSFVKYGEDALQRMQNKK
ncbi:MAG: hypothetical protein J6W52_12815 [Bacteroidaceae bacterium]|nr:hypothetical protein [Bacteroidaceae bacterium]